MTFRITTEDITLPALPGPIFAKAFDIDKNSNCLAVVETPRGLLLITPYRQIPLNITYADVRWLAGQALVFGPRARTQGEINAWIYDVHDGQCLKTISFGDGVEDIVVLRDMMAVSYFDEGHLTFKPPSDQGVAMFSLDGDYLWGYSTAIHRAVYVLDCYAMCATGPNRLAFFPHSGFEWVDLDMGTQQQTVTPTPERVHGSTALSCLGDTAFFRSPYLADGKSGAPNEEVFAFNRLANTLTHLGQLPGRHARGLPHGRMLVVNPDRVLIASFTQQKNKRPGTRLCSA